MMCKSKFRLYYFIFTNANSYLYSFVISVITISYFINIMFSYIYNYKFLSLVWLFWLLQYFILSTCKNKVIIINQILIKEVAMVEVVLPCNIQ